MLGMILTLIKPVNAALVGLFLWSNHKYWAASWIGVLMLCDIADGVVFRMSPWAVSPPAWWKTIFGINDLGWFRRVCDVVGDRIAVEFCLILIIIWFHFPLRLYYVELIRDLYLITIWLYGRWHKELTLRDPNLLSRISMAGVGLMAIFWLLDYPVIAYRTVWIVIGFGIAGAAQYRREVKTEFEVATPMELAGEMLMGLFLALVACLALVIVLPGKIIFGICGILFFTTCILRTDRVSGWILKDYQKELGKNPSRS